MLTHDHPDRAGRKSAPRHHDARAHRGLRAVRAHLQQRPIRASPAQRVDGLRRFPSRRGLGRVRPRSRDRHSHRAALQSRRYAGEIHHDHQPWLTRFQPAPSSLLRASLQHAQLGPLQRPLRLIEPSADRPIFRAASTACSAYARRGARASGQAQGRARQNLETAAWIAEKHLFQNYKQFQFFDLLALYFNRIHPNQRGEQTFGHVPLDAERDSSVTIRPREPGVYALSPFPFAADGAEFAFAGRLIEPGQQEAAGGWPSVLRHAPTRWENFRLVAA